MKTDKKDGNKAEILNVGVFSKGKDEVLNQVDEWVKSGSKGKWSKRLIYTPNTEMLVVANRKEEFREVLNSADINIPDAIGLLAASKLLGLVRPGKYDHTVSSRLPGVDMMVSLVRKAYVKGYKVFLLGGWARVAERAAGRLVRQFKAEGLKMGKGFEIEWESGPKKLSVIDGYKNGRIIRKVNEFEPDLLFVAFGPVRQEKWLYENRDKLKFNVGMGVGGSFDFISGRVPRAPKVMRLVGLEWLFRLIVEPWRWRRQLRLFEFIWLVIKEALGYE